MNIVIVGGGTAGWICAYLISHIQKFHNITVIDSSKIKILGAGESTTGFFTGIVNGSYGIDFFDFIKECDATIKTGVVLKNWSKYKETYYSPIDGSVTNNCPIDSSFYYAIKENKNVYNCNPYSFLMNNDLININKNNLNRHFECALHIDTYKTKEFFKKCGINNGVKCIDSSVENVILNENGFIKELILSNKTRISGDFFIDASGFNKKLISTVGSKFISFKKYLPVNQAISFNLEKKYNQNYSSVTTAQAMNYGWMWKIPTRDRYGMGYVYSKEHTNVDDALLEVEKFLETSVTVNNTINFESGRLDKFWNKNCLAIGTSGSFLEPLQATSIHTTIIQILEFIQGYLRNTFEKTYSEVSETNYNKFVSLRVDNFRDFVSCHYSGGKDINDFWKNIILTENVKHIIDLSKHRLLYRSDLDFPIGFAGYELWSYTLEGNGYFSKQKTKELFEDYPEYYHQGKQFYDNCINGLESMKNSLFTSNEFDNFITSKI